MTDGRIFFEVQRFDSERWITVELRETENMAMTVARALLARPQSTSVRVVRNRRRADGRSDETVIFIETHEATVAVITAVPISDAHMCSDIYDVYGIQSRMTVNRLFRKYIDMSFFTPTEMLHNYKALQKIQAHGNLFASGVDRVASLQGSLPGESYQGRRDILFDVTEKIARRARKVAEHPKLPSLTGADLGSVLDAVVGVAPPGREGFYGLVVLCNILVCERSWLSKFERLAAIIGSEPRDDVLALVDGVVADLIGAAAAFQDIMGYQRNLAQTLCSIADLYEGGFDAEKSDARDQLAVFGPLIAAGRMGQTRAALMDRMLLLLGSSQPLDRHDPSREKAAFRIVAERLQRPGSVFAGDTVAHVLDQRAIRLFGPNGAPPSPVDDAPAVLDAKTYAVFLAGLAGEGAHTQDFAAGSLIFRESEAGDCAYMVLSGSVELTTVFKGNRILLARLAVGAIFGELALFNDAPRTTSAVTLEGCRLRVIGRDEMTRRIEGLDPFCRHWVSYLTDRITDLSGRVAEAGSGSAK